MAKLPVSRRRFGGTIAIGIVALAGCADDPDDADDGEDVTDDSADEEPPADDNGDEEPPADDSDDEEEDDDEADDDSETEGMVRAVHGSPDAPNVDVYFDDELTLEDVPFRTVSDYLTVPASAYDVVITAAGDEDTVVYDDTVDIEADSAVTLVALGELEDDSFEVRGFEDDVSAVDDDEARVKVIHASPDAPNIDIVPEGSDDPLFADLAFGEASESETVPSDTYELEVRAAGEEDAVETFSVELDGATAYSAFAMGYLDPESAPVDEPLDLTVAVDTEDE